MAWFSEVPSCIVGQHAVLSTPLVEATSTTAQNHSSELLEQQGYGQESLPSGSLLTALPFRVCTEIFEQAQITPGSPAVSMSAPSPNSSAKRLD